jgi:cysteine desulfurase
MSSIPPNVFGYSDAVWQRFIAPAHAGILSGASIKSVEADSPAVKALLRLSARVHEGRIAEARFLAYGCPVTIAVGEWLAQWLGGRNLADLRLTATDIRLALEIADDRTHCALMGEDAIRRLQEQVEI